MKLFNFFAHVGVAMIIGSPFIWVMRVQGTGGTSLIVAVFGALLFFPLLMMVGERVPLPTLPAWQTNLAVGVSTAFWFVGSIFGWTAGILGIAVSANYLFRISQKNSLVSLAEGSMQQTELGAYLSTLSKKFSPPLLLTLGLLFLTLVTFDSTRDILIQTTAITITLAAMCAAFWAIVESRRGPRLILAIFVGTFVALPLCVISISAPSWLEVPLFFLALASHLGMLVLIFDAKSDFLTFKPDVKEQSALESE